MKFKKELAIAVFISILAQMSPAYGLSISVSGDAGGFYEVFQGNINDQFKGSTILAADSLSDTIAGSGSIKKRFFSNPSSIGSAEVGFDIKNAKSYSYDHYVDQNYVSVSDNLDVSNADKITAYASAHNSRGDSVSASTTVSGAPNGASLHGYSSSAMVWQTSSNYARANQGFESASGYTIQTNERAMNAEGDSASSRLAVIKGSVGRYNGGTYAGVDLSQNDASDWHYESDQASVSHGFYIPSATKIQTDETAKNAERDTASSGIVVASGFMNSYHGVAYSGLTQTYGNGPSSKNEYATAYNDDYGLSGAKIYANEKATNIMGDMASSQTEITKGSMDAYRGSADANLYKNDYLSQESQYASVGQGITGLTGIKAKIDEKAFNTKGIFTGTSMTLCQGSLDSYFGNAAAGWSQGENQWDGANAKNYLYHVSGKELDLKALAINIKGFMKYKSTRLKHPANIDYENSAEVNFGVPSVYQGQK
jgi:hypothetical protein